MPRKKKSLFRNLISHRRGDAAPAKPRPARQPGPQIDNLEGRVVLSHVGFPGQAYGYGAYSQAPAQVAQDPGMIQAAPLQFAQGADAATDVSAENVAWGSPGMQPVRTIHAPASRGFQGAGPGMSFEFQGQGNAAYGPGIRGVGGADGFATARGWQGAINTTVSSVTQSVSGASVLPAQPGELVQDLSATAAPTNVPYGGQPGGGGFRAIQGTPAAGFQNFRGAAPASFRSFQGGPVAITQGIGGHQAARWTSANAGGDFTPASGFGQQDEQLAEHQETLRTDLEAIIGESGVTDAQRWAFRKDIRALAEADLQLDPEALSPVADDVFSAIADGSFDANLETIRGDFAATFSASADDEGSLTDEELTLVNQTFDHFVAIAKGLNLTTDKLDVLTADRKAIQDDLDRLEVDSTAAPVASTNLDLILSPGQGTVARFARPRA